MPEPDPASAESDELLNQDRAESALLQDLTIWREQLARSIARNNPDLRSEQIILAVNRILFPLLLLRIAEDRLLVPRDTIADLRDLRTVPQIISDLSRYADALFAENSLVSPRSPDSGNDFVIEERVVRVVLEGLLCLEWRYDFGKMSTRATANVLMHYLSRTVRRSASHQATVVDTHETLVCGGLVIPPPSLIGYMVKQTLNAARENRTAHEILPLRVFDPACGSGTVLLAVYQQLIDTAGGSALAFEERREILAQSVYGLDINRHAVALTRMVLALELCDGRQAVPSGCDFSEIMLSVLRELRHTILCGNALVGPEIVNDESWMFCPARDRHTLNPFVYIDRFPEILSSGGFDAVVSNPPEGPLEQREWIQQYFQRRYAVYNPLIDRSAYFVEKSLSLVRPGGFVTCAMNNRWLRGSNGSPLRELISTMQIGEIVDLSTVSAGKPGAGMSILRIRAAPPSHSFLAVPAGSAFIDEPYAFVAACAFPVDPRHLDKGGWALRDTRADAVLRTVSRHTTPLEEVVMGQLHTGIRILEDDPFVIDEKLAREWLRQDPRCKPLLRRVVDGSGIGRYRNGAGKFLILIPQGWTHSHPGAVKRPWHWLKRRHPLIARYLQPFAAQLNVRTGKDSHWWESAYDLFWQEPGKKILFPVRFERPVFFVDDGKGIGNETTNAIPSAGQYLAGILNSRLIAFIFNQSARDKKIFTWDDIRNLPIYSPDFDRRTIPPGTTGWNCWCERCSNSGKTAGQQIQILNAKHCRKKYGERMRRSMRLCMSSTGFHGKRLPSWNHRCQRSPHVTPFKTAISASGQPLFSNPLNYVLKNGVPATRYFAGSELAISLSIQVE